MAAKHTAPLWNGWCRVEVKIPVDQTDSKSTQQKIQGHPLIESLSRALEGEVIGVHARSENRDV